MSDEQELYADKWGRILGDAGRRHIEIDWTLETANMSAADFVQWLTRFAALVEFGRCRTALVDARSFRIDPAGLDMGWRDKQIIPRYNAAGVQKFAFVMPAGMPAIGAEPAPEGPAQFPTAYFAGRAVALAWLKET